MAGHEHVNSLGHWAGKAGTEARKSTFRRKTFHFLEKLNNVVFLMSGAWERCMSLLLPLEARSDSPGESGCKPGIPVAPGEKH